MSAPHIAISIEAGNWPPKRDIEALARRALDAADAALASGVPSGVSPNPSLEGRAKPELSIVFTNDTAMQELNRRWRGKDFPTNVLSFPQSVPPDNTPKSRKSAPSHQSGQLLGDVILSAETVAHEAALADKPLVDHMAHLIIHGYLHLLGFDHEGEADAEKMEQLERVALKELGIPDPYAAASGE